ncbi:enamine deaminase RidA (YjgF/YER057c/UK114 family) [Rhizobium sp. BK456]|nr:enamine deaminase RidA (YjgF/YER057c/UK114 family) [Rhizobium sp. BK456]
MFGNEAIEQEVEALPAQTLIPVPKLAIDPMLFEVEAVVVLE